MIFIYCVTFQVHVIKALFHFMARSPSKYVTMIPSFKHRGVGDMMVLGSHVSSNDQVIKGSCKFRGNNPSRYVTILPSLIAIGFLVVEI